MSVDKDFVPYTEALSLKKLGFDEEGLGMYSKNGSVLPLVPYTSEDKAILFSQAFRWFREKYDMCPTIEKITEEDVYKFEYDVWAYTSQTYEEAELACLRRLIEIRKRGGNK